MVVLSIVLANWLPNFVETLGNSNVGFPLLWAKYRKAHSSHIVKWFLARGVGMILELEKGRSNPTESNEADTDTECCNKVRYTKLLRIFFWPYRGCVKNQGQNLRFDRSKGIFSII